MTPAGPPQILGKLLLGTGIFLVLAGLALLYWDRLPLRHLPLGRLPGDIIIRRPGLSLYFPWVTCLGVSLLVSLILHLLRK